MKMTFTGNLTVTATKGQTTEEWVINPRYLPGDELWAFNRLRGRNMELKDAEGQPIITPWVEPEGSRAWTKKSGTTP